MSDHPGTSSDPPKEDKPNKATQTTGLTLKDIISMKRKEMAELQPNPSGRGLYDPYANASGCRFVTRGGTGVIYDEKMLAHYCDWDPRHPESPERLSTAYRRCKELKLLEHCKKLPNKPREDLQDKILLKHSVEHYEKLRDICLTRSHEMENESSNYDSIYFNRCTFEAASTAVNCALNLVHAITGGIVMNGFAFVRPPGHHAMYDEYNGYCFFNTVAIAAESVLMEGLKKKIMIIDFDVHHGQSTQQMFYNRKDVLYFSIHRYEHGTFWPNLTESNFNYIGKDEGLGYNINVPLNETGLTDSDYLAIVFNILLPVAYEFNPDFIIVSAGYDAAMGCPEGKMKVTPGFYCHLISLLTPLAEGQIAVVLEGGYCVSTMAESTAMTLKGLLGGPCPILDPVTHINQSVIDTICNVRRMLYNYWNCFKVCELENPMEGQGEDPNVHKFQIGYFGVAEKPPYPVKGAYPLNSDVDIAHYRAWTLGYRERCRAALKKPVYYVYDDLLLTHAPPDGESDRPEKPDRLVRIMQTLKEFEVEKRLRKRQIRRRSFGSYTTHSRYYLEMINPTMAQSTDVYINENTNDCVRLAVCGLMDLADSIMEGACRSGVGIIRPPGHHAEHNKAMGYCFMNNVAVTANYFHLRYKLQRILIVDFDIHHGNGTQNMFYESNNVMYISIHRHEDGKYFPKGSPRTCDYDGYGQGKGFNINIPFNKDKMGDTEYIATFQNVVLPAAYAFAPEVVIVSAGFDAGINDPLGGYGVNPETYGHLIWMLRGLGEGRLIVALEGGYNLSTTAYSMTICAKALLGDPIIMPKNPYVEFSSEAIKSIREVSNHFKQYYEVFNVSKQLGLNPVLLKKVKKWKPNSYTMEVSRPLDRDRMHDNEYIEKKIKEFNLI